VVNFSSLYPPGTAMLIQVKAETTAADIIQLILQRSFTVSFFGDFDKKARREV
jgi:hypothetical protein